MLFDEHGFGDDGTRAAGTGKWGDGRAPLCQGREDAPEMRLVDDVQDLRDEILEFAKRVTSGETLDVVNADPTDNAYWSAPW